MVPQRCLEGPVLDWYAAHETRCSAIRPCLPLYRSPSLECSSALRNQSPESKLNMRFFWKYWYLPTALLCRYLVYSICNGKRHFLGRKCSIFCTGERKDRGIPALKPVFGVFLLKTLPNIFQTSFMEFMRTVFRLSKHCIHSIFCCKLLACSEGLQTEDK